MAQWNVSTVAHIRHRSPSLMAVYALTLSLVWICRFCHLKILSITIPSCIEYAWLLLDMKLAWDESNINVSLYRSANLISFSLLSVLECSHSFRYAKIFGTKTALFLFFSVKIYVGGPHKNCPGRAILMRSPLHYLFFFEKYKNRSKYFAAKLCLFWRFWYNCVALCITWKV